MYIPPFLLPLYGEAESEGMYICSAIEENPGFQSIRFPAKRLYRCLVEKVSPHLVYASTTCSKPKKRAVIPHICISIRATFLEILDGLS